ncbi:MAG: hypothetical protein ABJA75_21210 [Bradyrhizobium sp.]
MCDDGIRHGWLRRLLSRFEQSRPPRAVDELSTLNGRLLRDIGIAEDDVETEKWFWRGSWSEITSTHRRHHRW